MGSLQEASCDEFITALTMSWPEMKFLSGLLFQLFHCFLSHHSAEFVFKCFILCISNCQAEEIPISVLGLDNRKFPLLSFFVYIYLSDCEIYSKSIHLPPKSIH